MNLLSRLETYLYGNGKSATGRLLSYSDIIPADVLNTIRLTRQKTDMLLTDLDAYNVYRFALEANKVRGDVAEVGTYRGGSAKLISLATDKPAHFFDTFEGLPEPTSKDIPHFVKGAYPAPLQAVMDAVGNPHATFYKGIFPENAPPSLTFSFVHLDVDLYQSTLDSLAYFYPCLVRGAILMSHDYSGDTGAKKAIDEFFADKPEIIVPLTPSNECLIIKL